jgi:hypothetical protein
MGINKFKTVISQAVVAAGLVLGSAVASAATVSVVPLTQDVFAGDTVTVDLVASDLVSSNGGSMDIQWDSTVLTMSGALQPGTTDLLAAVTIANPPWNDPTDGCTTGGGFSCTGVLSPGLLSGIRVGTFDFVTDPDPVPIATLTFTAADTTVPLSTLVRVADGAAHGGWSPAIPPENYNAGTVNVISTPPDLVDLSGTIKTVSDTDICAMVLASGQFMFSCNPVGVFSLSDLPRENDDTVKRQIYADGFFPKIDILTGSGVDSVVMSRSGACPGYNTPYDPGFVPDSAGKRIDISGSVLLQDTQTPICAMVLANGQFTFSCDGSGSYALNIPLDTNGQFKLQVYADGFAPTIQTFDEFQSINDVRMARAVECQ